MEQTIEQFVEMFAGLLYEALPFIVLGAVVAGILEELVPQQLVVRLIPRSRSLAIAIGGLLGLLFPMCECGIIPVMRRLLRKGVPLSACVCYMLAGPIINVIVMLSTYVAFSSVETQPAQAQAASSGRPVYRQLNGWEMTAMRMGLGYAVAFGTSLIVEWQYRKHGNKLLTPLAQPPAGELDKKGDNGEKTRTVRPPWWKRLSNICETSLHDFVDVSVFLIFGGLLASFARLFLQTDRVGQLVSSYPPMLIGVVTILIMMGLAILLCICSEADAFVAASFRELPAASKVAFLVLGPMLDLKLYMMYTRVFRPRLIWTIIVSVVIQVFIWAILLNFFLEDLPRLLGYGS